MNLNEIKSKSFVYLRRSQDREDRQMLSIDKQDSQVRGILDKHYLIPIYLPAEERSAKTPGRPIFNDMMDRIDAGEARYISVWNLSRLSRNPVDGGRVINAMDTGKLLAIHTPTRSYRNTPDDKMMLAIELAFAKKNNDDLSAQVKEGFEEKRARGQYPGPAPMGYLNVIVRPGERNIAPDPEKGPLVVKIFEAAATGQYSLENLFVLAQEIGLKSIRDNELSKSTISDMLKRKVYTGIFKYNEGDEYFQGSYTPLITTELYSQVQISMGWSKRGSKANTAKLNYPYKGVVTCIGCNFNITAYTKEKTLANNKLGYYTFYKCTRKSKVVRCTEPQVPKDTIETEIEGQMHDYTISSDDSVKCLEMINQYYDETLQNRNQFLNLWKKDHKEASDKIDFLDDMLESRTISPEKYKNRVSKHQDTQVRTAQLINKSSQDARQWLELATEVFSNTVDLGKIFESANDDERRKMMQMLGSNWKLGNKKVTLTAREPLDLLHISNRNQDWRARPGSNWRSPP